MVTLGNQLRSDNDINFAGSDSRHHFCRLMRAGDGVRGHYKTFGVGEKTGNLLFQALDSGAANSKAILNPAFRTKFRGRD